MISLLSRSDASARAFIARSCERSVDERVLHGGRHERGLGALESARRASPSRAAAKSLRTAKASTAASTATIAVRPRKR